MKKKGITLVEVLIATALLSLTAALFYAILRVTSRGYESAKADNILQQNGPPLLQGILEDIRKAKGLGKAERKEMILVLPKKSNPRYHLEEGRLLKEDAPLESGEVYVSSVSFFYFGMGPQLDENADGEVDEKELDRDGDGMFLGDEISGIRLVRVEIVVSYKERRMSFRGLARVASDSKN